MAIWGRSTQTGKVEKIDDGDSAYLLNEYRLAFGRSFTLWRGRKMDEPGRCVGCTDPTAHGPERGILAECWTCHTLRPGRDPVVLLTPAAMRACRAAGHDVRVPR